MTPINSTISSHTFANAATQTLSMDELCREYLQEHQSKNDKIVEDLRPLCEELPPDALDPVTFEPLDRALNFRCGHALNSTTVVQIAKSSGIASKQGRIDCPVCRTSQIIDHLGSSIPFIGCIKLIKKINSIFKNAAEEKS